MTDKLPADVLDVISTRLEARGTHEYFREMLHEYLDAVEIDSAAKVLEIGCGTGVATREIVGRPQFNGKIVATDLSEHLVKVAGELAAQEGMSDTLQFVAADCRNLDFPNDSFDVVIAHTLVSHVPGPLQVLKEMARLVKSNGKVAVFDGDYASLSWSNEDPTKAQEYDEKIQSAVITNPRVMREMPRLMREAGFTIDQTFSYVLAEMGSADFWAPALESMRRLVPNSGVMSAEEINAWVDARFKESEEGAFFGVSNFYSIVASCA